MRTKNKREVWGLKDSLSELSDLAKGAGAEVVSTVTQTIKKHSITYVGKGKLDQLRGVVSDQNIDTIICDDELDPNQQLQLERSLENVKIIDRTALILDIFASSAQTREGRLQVELAQHEY